MFSARILPLVVLLVGTMLALPATVSAAKPLCLPCPCMPSYSHIVPMCSGGGVCQAPCPWAINPYNNDEFPAYTIDPNFIVAPCSASNPNQYGFQGPFPCGGASWQDDQYWGTNDDPTQQLITYQSSWLGKTGVLVCSSADTAGLAGCHADYKSSLWSQGCWGYTCGLAHPTGADTLNIPLKWLGTLTVTVYNNNMTPNGGGNYYADIYLDYWLHWPNPVGTNGFKDMEFMIFLQRDQFGCPIHPQNIHYAATNNYFYGRYLNCATTGNWSTYTISDSDMQLYVADALGWFGGLPLDQANILGIDFGQEIGSGSMTANFDYYFQNFCYTATCPLANGQTLG